MSEAIDYLHAQQQEKHGDIPEYVRFIKESIEKAPDPPKYFITNLRRGEAAGQLGQEIEYLSKQLPMPEKRQALTDGISNYPHLGVRIGDNELQLEAVGIERYLAARSVPAILECPGYHEMQIMESPLNMRKQLLEAGVYGSREINRPTYLKLPGSTVNLQKKHQGYYPLFLYIDPYILTQYRTVFSDPTGLTSSKYQGEFGNSFLVLGGIPAPSIVGVSTDANAPVLLVKK